jgi:hypothetical protein
MLSSAQRQLFYQRIDEIAGVDVRIVGQGILIGDGALEAGKFINQRGMASRKFSPTPSLRPSLPDGRPGGDKLRP